MGKASEFFACWSSGSLSTDAWNQCKFPQGRKITEQIDEDWFIAGDPEMNELMRNTSPQSLGIRRLNISDEVAHMKQLSGQSCCS